MSQRRAFTSFKFGDKLLIFLVLVCLVQHLMLRKLQGAPPPGVVSTLSSSVQAKPTSGSFPPCSKNPYVGALEPLSTITEKMDDWFQNLNDLGTKSLKRYTISWCGWVDFGITAVSLPDPFYSICGLF
jgi:hypothetical protein